MSSDWRECSLGDLIAIKHGYAFSGEHITKTEGKCVLVTPGNFEISGGYKEGNAKYFHGEYPEEYVFAGGDLVVTMTDLSKTADTLGYSAKIPREKGKIYLHNQRIGKVCSKSSEAELDYLYWIMRHKDYRSWVVNTATGSTVKHTSPSRILEYSFLLPPICDQKAIAHILSTLDDKIELNRKINETLEAMAKAIFKSWFVDFDPVRAKAEGRPTGLPAEISDLFPDSFEDSELGEIPCGWRVAPVGDVVECVGGSTPSTNEPEYWDGGEYFWATPKDLSSLSEPFLLDTAKKITADGVQRISSGILPVGTVLLSSRAPVGYVAAACVPVSINQGFIALRSNGLMSSAYLLNWCLSNVQQFKDRASGTTFAEISKAAFRPIPLLVPSEQVATPFSDKAQALYERVVSNMRQSTLLAATRDALLPKLISGEIRIPDAEKMLEAVGI